MKAVARIESGFNPKQRTGSYIGLFQLSKYEFNKFGSGQILDPRDNAVAAAYKVITEGILFEWVTHKKPTLSDLYLIQSWRYRRANAKVSANVPSRDSVGQRPTTQQRPPQGRPVGPARRWHGAASHHEYA
jgi:hypothetical protein